MNKSKTLKTIFVPTTTLVGREELYTQLGFFLLRQFFVELWVVSINRTFIQKYEIEKSFSSFVYYKELSRFNFCINPTVFFIFSVIFDKIWQNFANII